MELPSNSLRNVNEHNLQNGPPSILTKMELEFCTQKSSHIPNFPFYNVRIVETPEIEPVKGVEILWSEFGFGPISGFK